MRELSLNILDVAQNSIAAGASLIEISVREDTVNHEMRIGVYDDGCGMTQEQAQRVLDPFYTTRTTRRVGMGIPLFKMAAEMTGGSLHIWSQRGIGTKLDAVFQTDSIDFTPLGDICSTMIALITMNTDRDFIYRHSIDGNEFVLETMQLKEILGDIPLSEPDVAAWIKEFIEEQTQMIRGGKIE